MNIGKGSHPNMVKVFGPGVERTGLKANEPTHFTVDCSGAGDGEKRHTHTRNKKVTQLKTHLTQPNNYLSSANDSSDTNTHSLLVCPRNDLNTEIS